MLLDSYEKNAHKVFIWVMQTQMHLMLMVVSARSKSPHDVSLIPQSFESFIILSWSMSWWLPYLLHILFVVHQTLS
jgi:hypothetical protein